MRETCSICGDAPAGLVDKEHKATYWLCLECAVERVMDGIEERAALEAKLEAMERVKMHLQIIMRLTTKDEVWQYLSLDVLAILESLAAAQQEQEDD